MVLFATLLYNFLYVESRKNATDENGTKFQVCTVQASKRKPFKNDTQINFPFLTQQREYHSHCLAVFGMFFSDTGLHSFLVQHYVQRNNYSNGQSITPATILKKFKLFLF